VLSPRGHVSFANFGAAVVSAAKSLVVNGVNAAWRFQFVD
jgi:hypothetical protein